MLRISELDRKQIERRRELIKERDDAEEKQRQERQHYSPNVHFCDRCGQPCSSVGCPC